MRHPRAVVVIASGILALCAACWAIQDPPRGPAGSAPPATNSPPATRPAPADAISQPILQEMYRAELGAKYNPADADKLYAAHGLLEQYFAAATASERKAIVGRLRAVGLDPNVVGRLTRLRMDWPALDAGGVYYVNEQVGPHPVNYFFGVPKAYDRTKPWPLVIKLPGAGAFLTNPPPDGDQVADIYTGWIREELDRHPDAVVLMPRLNLGELYGPSYAGMNTVVQPLLHVAGRANIDPARVYLIGHSMAAHAVWNLGLHYTTYFAALNPMAGSASGDWQRLRVMNLKNVLPVVWDDADDPVVRPELTRAVVRALRAQKVDVDFEETKGLGHAPDAATVERMYQKVRARARNLYPPQVSLQSNRPDPMFNRLDWVQAWEPASAGKERRVLFRYGSGFMMVNDNTLRIDAARPRPNRFEITTQNVGSLRLYFNDQTVNFKDPVTILVNRKTVYEGALGTDVEEMLKDQLFLGRGWRYFTSAVDVDVDLLPAAKPATRPATKPATRPTAPPRR